MKLVLSIALVLVASACSAPERHRPELARSEIVPVQHQSAQEIAGRVCGRMHGAKPGSPEDKAGGCTSVACAREGHADEEIGVSLIADTRTNSLVVTAARGHEADLERVLALVEELDRPSTAAR